VKGCENRQKAKIIDIYYSGVFSALGKWIENPDTISAEDLLALIRNLFSSWFWPELTKGC